MTYVEMQNEVLRLNNHIKEWVSFVEELKDENTELKARLQELQNAFDDGIDVEVTATDNGYVVIEPVKDEGNNVRSGSFKGKVVIDNEGN